LRRFGVVAAGVLVAVAGLIALAVAFNALDDPEVASAPTGPGELQPDRGSGHDSVANAGDEWPTSGPHRDELVTRDRRPLSDDQVLHALELGNIVILYDAPDPGAALERLQDQVAGPFDAELAAAGQAVILARRKGAGPATALAWRRVYETADARDPALREFTEAWLGRGLGK
jgi:Protein of unknown function (DUF3105)